MSQATMTLTPTSTHTQAPTTPACPAWCTESAHFDGSPHFGGMFDIDLSLGDPALVITMDGTATVGDFVTVDLFQAADADSPAVGLSYGPAAELADMELPNLTVDEAESLARALLELVRRARTAA